MVILALMISPGFDGMAVQDLRNVVARGWVFIDPFLDCGEHVALDLDVVGAESRVVESTDDVVGYFVDGDGGVFPGVEDSSIVTLALNPQRSGRESTYGTAYCKIVAATLPATGFK
jgi:hypothetical protein